MQGNLTTPIPARKAQLLIRLGELGVRLAAIEEELDSHQNRDWEDLATEREGDEVLEATGNAGKAERWGSELELQWSPLDNLLVAATWAHLDGDFEEYPELCGTGAYASTCIQTEDLALRSNAADDQLSLVTDWVFAQTDWADFMAALRQSGYQGDIGMEYRPSGDSAATLAQATSSTMPDIWNSSR